MEKERGVSPRTRNVRLAAIHSFFKYAAFCEPGQSGLIQRVLAIPTKRHSRAPVEFLSRGEIDALLAAPDGRTWIGRRDRALLLVAVQCGLRVSELIRLRCQDAVLGSGAHVRCRGKGRKERCTPLRTETRTVLRSWMHEQGGESSAPLFPSIRGGGLSRDAVEHLVAKHAATASHRCTALKGKRVSPHVLRHSAAMDLHLHGVDRSVIALWLGHESVQSTQVYLHANLAIKEAALARTDSLNARGGGRFRPGDRLLAFLEGL